jgi:hypothetical protein
MVRIQARTPGGTWATLAQLHELEASEYIAAIRSDRFLEAVEQHAKKEATHLRKIRVDDSAFRIIPTWKQGVKDPD